MEKLTAEINCPTINFDTVYALRARPKNEVEMSQELELQPKLTRYNQIKVQA